jgi:hypothetical protein|nr:MAG TPA: hypothetical protein [Caudoviricetes sp.]
MGNSKSCSNRNTKDEIRYLPENIVKVSIDMDEYLRLKEVEKECVGLRKDILAYKSNSIFVEEHEVCYERLYENLYNELEVLYTKYRGSAIWNLDITLCGVIAFFVRKYLEGSPEAFDYDENSRLRYNTLVHAVTSLEYYFDKANNGGDSLNEEDRELVLEALSELREYWFSMWT